MRALSSKDLRKALLIAALFFGVTPFSVLPPLHAQQTQPAAKQDSGESENDAMRHSATVTVLGHMLHLQPEQAARTFEWINFAILAAALGWALTKSLPKAFRNRTSGIEKNLVEARTATESANIRLAQVEERLSRLDTEIASIRTQSEADAKHDEERIKAAAEEDKRKVVAEAEQEIAAATAQAQREIRRFAAEMVIEQATQRLQITADLDRQLIEEFAGKLVPTSGKGGEN